MLIASFLCQTKLKMRLSVKMRDLMHQISIFKRSIPIPNFILNPKDYNSDYEIVILFETVHNDFYVSAKKGEIPF